MNDNFSQGSHLTASHRKTSYFDMCVLNFIKIWRFCFISAYELANDLFFPRNSFQRSSIIFCLLVPEALKIVIFFYSGFTLQQNNTLQQNITLQKNIKSIGFIYIYRCSFKFVI